MVILRRFILSGAFWVRRIVRPLFGLAAALSLISAVIITAIDWILEMSSENKPPYKNRLAEEKSPYLLQHADNPVDWYPWGEEAFDRAKKEEKPIFLSIGYSTCHWCHVMEHESFEDIEVAKLMNDVFVCIKVDRGAPISIIFI
jgi:thiol:disulfide interchange protein